jgi:hypothetical protein
MPVERIIIEKIAPQDVDYANLPEYKALMSSLKTLEEKQDNLKQLMITSQELQEANKIEVSVNSSDEEIVTMLQADQQLVRKILLSVSDLLQDSRTSLGVTLDTVLSNIESLSMKITNNSELYVGNLEHSKIINDIVKSLDDVRSNIETIETYYMNDVNKQFTELTNIHRDLSEKIEGIKQDLETQFSGVDKVHNTLVNGFNKQDNYVLQIGEVMDGITELLGDIKADKSVDSVIEKVDQVTVALAEMRISLAASTEASVENLHGFEKTLSDNIDKTLQRFEENILGQYNRHHDDLILKIDNIISSSSSENLSSAYSGSETEALYDDDNKSSLADDLSINLQKFEENIQNSLQKSHDAILEKIDDKLSPPAINYQMMGTIAEADVPATTATEGFPQQIVNETFHPPAHNEISASEKNFPVPAVDELKSQSTATSSVCGSIDLTDDDLKARETFEPSNFESENTEQLPPFHEESSFEAAVLSKGVEDVVSSANNMMSSDSSDEPILYPGVVEERKSSVYLYSAFVAVSTVIVYFLK